MGLRFRVQGLGFKVEGGVLGGFRGFRVQGLGFRGLRRNSGRNPNITRQSEG